MLIYNTIKNKNPKIKFTVVKKINIFNANMNREKFYYSKITILLFTFRFITNQVININ